MSNLSGSGTLRGSIRQGGGGPSDVYWDDILNKPTFAKVATSGSYNDLSDKPNIPEYTAGNGIDITNNVISATGGGGSVRYGETDPTEGNDGELYFKTINSITSAQYFKLEIYNNRDNIGVTQLSELKLVDNNGNEYSWNSGATASTNVPPASSGENADKLLDNNTGTKLCVNNYVPSNTNPLIITINANEVVDFSIYNKWDWYTADDSPERDPITYSFYASQNGSDWLEVDAVIDTLPPTARKTLAYTGRMKVGKGVLNKYLNAYGQWLEY